MKLQHIAIKNFRSIEDVAVDFGSPMAVILVGMNESGKSNILQAMHLLSSEVKPSPKDVRIPRSKDGPIDEAYIKFRFLLGPDASSELTNSLLKELIAHSKDEPIVEKSGKLLSLKDYLQHKQEVIYVVDMIKSTKTLRYFSEPKGSKVLKDWVIVKDDVPPGATVQVFEGSVTPIQAGQIIHTSSLVDSTPSWSEPLTIALLDNFIGRQLIAFAKPNLPASILWDYQKENILPSEIDIEGFAANPDSCIPLKNIFELAGEEEIGKCLRDNRTLGIHHFKALLNRISEKATSYIREAWKDHKDLSIKLEPNGPSITISISDAETGFSFEQRSDGFKRFTTFLLLVAARVRTNDIENTLLLLDEPEISLHPSGIRNMRDELFRIAQTNYVVIATHSPFMIDRDEFSRNRIVSKKKEVTRIEGMGDSSRMYEEEVLLSALGTSVFEIVKTQNVIFEGWRDKKLFEVFRASLKAGDECWNLLEFGFCHAQGVKDIKNLSPFFQVCDRNLLIVTDSDATALQRKQEHEKERGHGRWITYSDIFPDGPTPETAEDFVIRKSLAAAALVANAKIGAEVHLKPADIPDIQRAEYVKSVANATLPNSEASKKWLDHWKSAVFDNLKITETEVRLRLAAKAILTNIVMPRI